MPLRDAGDASPVGIPNANGCVSRDPTPGHFQPFVQYTIMKTAIIGSLALAALTFPVQAISITAAGSIYSQNFDALASTAGTGIVWANDSTLPGWSLFQRTGAAVATYNAGTGSSATGSFYSFGTSAATERALGGVGAGTAYFGSPAVAAAAGWIAASFVNNSGGILDRFDVSWVGEQWRNGGNTTAQTMVFEYGFGASFTGVSSWSAPGGLFDFTSVVNAATAAAVDGNAAGLVAGRGGSVTGLSWAVNDTLWLRWVEKNDADSDHGLASDNFSLTAGTAASVPDSGTTGTLFGITLAGLVALRRQSGRATTGQVQAGESR